MTLATAAIEVLKREAERARTQLDVERQDLLAYERRVEESRVMIALLLGRIREIESGLERLVRFGEAREESDA